MASISKRWKKFHISPQEQTKGLPNWKSNQKFRTSSKQRQENLHIALGSPNKKLFNYSIPYIQRKERQYKKNRLDEVKETYQIMLQPNCQRKDDSQQLRDLKAKLQLISNEASQKEQELLEAAITLAQKYQHNLCKKENELPFQLLSLKQIQCLKTQRRKQQAINMAKMRNSHKQISSAKTVQSLSEKSNLTTAKHSRKASQYYAVNT